MNIIKPVNEEKDHWVGFFVLLERKHISLVVKVKGQGSFGDQLHHLLFLLLLLSCGYIVLTPCYFWLQVPDEAVSKCTSCGSDFGAFIRRVLFSLILQSELSSWPWYAKLYGFFLFFSTTAGTVVTSSVTSVLKAGLLSLLRIMLPKSVFVTGAWYAYLSVRFSLT